MSRVYDRAAWKRLRIAYLSEHPFCEACEELGYPGVPAEHVDHKIPVRKAPELKLDKSNLQALCIPCHSSKTQTEDVDGAVRGSTLDGTPRDPNHPWNQEE